MKVRVVSNQAATGRAGPTKTGALSSIGAAAPSGRSSAPIRHLADEAGALGPGVDRLERGPDRRAERLRRRLRDGRGGAEDLVAGRAGGGAEGEHEVAAVVVRYRADSRVGGRGQGEREG